MTALMPPVTRQWRSSPAKRALAVAAHPVFHLLNRPSMRWFGQIAYDFALRCNGIAINFPGRNGLTAGEERFAARILKDAPAGILLDVGANKGAYAAYLATLSPQSTIYAFEPHPLTFAALQARVAAANVQAVNLAVSDEAGTLTLHDFAGEDGSTQASLDPEAIHMFSAETVTHSVGVTTIDAFLAEHGIDQVTLLKIDTEGFDLAVLKGARGALSRRAIRAIQFEFIPANIARRVTMRDFFEVLAGYRLFRLCVNGDLWPLDIYDVKRCEIYVTHNLVALPREVF